MCEWLRDRSVQGIGVGRPVRSGIELKQRSIKVFVDRKRPESQCGDACVPKRIDLPGIDELLPTDVIEVGELAPHGFTTKVRPVRPGFGISRFDGPAGTVGLIVRRASETGELFVLSNCHVLARVDDGQIGARVVQPAADDDLEPPADPIGALTQFVRIEPSEDGYTNEVDAAIARLDDNIDATNDLPILGKPTGIGQIRDSMTVQIIGRTSGHNIGKIIATDFLWAPFYRLSDGRMARVGFRHQVACTPYASPGDSGAAVLSNSGKIVGLHVGGSAALSIFTPIRAVFRALDVELA